MTEDANRSNEDRNNSVAFAAVLTTFLTIAIPGSVYSLFSAYFLGHDNIKGGRSGSFIFGIVATTVVGFAFSGGTALSSPLLICFARIAKPRHSGVLAFVGTVMSCVLFFTGLTGRVAALFNFHTNLIDFYEPIAALVAVQIALIAVLCLVYRGIPRRSAG